MITKIQQISCCTILVLSSFLCTKTGIAQDSKSTIKIDRELILTAAREMMDSVDYCALITLDKTGQPHVRTMDPFSPEEDTIVWLGTTKNSRKVMEIKNDARVSLYYADPGGSGYVTIEGTAFLIDDENEKSKRWKKEWEEFYPDREKTYILIKIVPKKLSVISYKHGLSGDPETWAAHTVEFSSIE